MNSSNSVQVDEGGISSEARASSVDSTYLVCKFVYPEETSNATIDDIDRTFGMFRAGTAR